jgi:hypothetical protein
VRLGFRSPAQVEKIGAIWDEADAKQKELFQTMREGGLDRGEIMYFAIAKEEKERFRARSRKGQASPAPERALHQETGSY